MKTLVLLALVGFVAAQIQVQIPIQRPQQPQQPPQRQPVQPRQDWRTGFPDTRCPVPDDHLGWPVFLPSSGQWDFFMCWGGIAWPFSCPGDSVWWHAERTCAFEEQIAEGRFRPFNEELEDNE